MPTDRDLLYGTLAVHLGFTTTDELREAAEKAAKTQTSLVRVLSTSVSLPIERSRLLEALVAESLRRHDGDVRSALDVFGGEESALSLFEQPNGERVEAVTAPEEDEGLVTLEQSGRYRASNEPTRDSKELGRGAIGRVFVAFDQHLGREVAIKELLPERVASERASQESSFYKTSAVVMRFLREARVTGQLEHPNIVPVYELGRRPDGTLYYTMKVVRGRTLAQAIKQAGNLEQRLRLLNHFIDLCQAVAASVWSMQTCMARSFTCSWRPTSSTSGPSWETTASGISAFSARPTADS